MSDSFEHDENNFEDVNQSEAYIHDLYERNQREQRKWKELEAAIRAKKFSGVDNPAEFTGPVRWAGPSFRSQYFNVGEGIQVLAAGQTLTLAKKTVPLQHGGVLTGLVQVFVGCLESVINQITWGLRINGEPARDLSDFVGQFSLPSQPMEVFFPLTTGAQTLGGTSTSPGGGPQLQTPTVFFQATNNSSSSVVLQARVIGYTFPISERNDEFNNL